MKTANKWNFDTHQYAQVQLPHTASCYEQDQDKIITCANCNDFITFGESHKSIQYHTEPFGFGPPFMVCKECSEKEIEQRERNNIECYTDV